jgi:hypothetical protein
MAKAQPPRQRRMPIRTCIACRQVSGKREFVRVVRTPDAGVKIDLTGKLSGRGAYLCKSRQCWQTALQGNRLNVALKVTLSQDEVAALSAFAETLAPEAI